MSLRNFLLILSILITGCSKQMQKKENGLISRKILFSNPDKASVKLSPNGEYITFLAPVNGVLNVHIAPSSDINNAEPITYDKNRGIRTYMWLYDNKHITYLQDKDGDENGHVHLVNINTKEDKDITAFDYTKSYVNHVSPDFPNEFIIESNKRDKRYFDIYRYNIQSNQLNIIYENKSQLTSFILDDNYAMRFASLQLHSGGINILKFDKNLNTKLFLNIHPEDYYTTSILGFNKNLDSIYMINSKDKQNAALVSVNINNKHQDLIYENSKSDVDEIFMHPTEKKVLAVSDHYLKPEMHIIDESIKVDFDYLGSVLNSPFSIVSTNLSNDKWIVAYMSSNEPVQYYLYDRKQQNAKKLFSNRKILENHDLSPMHPIVIKSRDNLDLVSYLTLPLSVVKDKNDASPSFPVPLIIDVHGGPKARDYWGLNLEHQWLANRGYAVLTVNYRGSTGFTKNFTNLGDGEWGGKMHDDLIDAVEWAIQNNITTKDKVAIYGGSYGGYATLIGLTFTPDVFACGVNIVGVSNLKTLLESIPPYWKPFYSALTKQIGGNLESKNGLEFLNARSPINYVNNITKPLLIAHGANDPRVKKAESDQMVTAMRANNIPVTYLLYPDEGHGFAKPQNRISFYAMAEEFLAKCLNGKFEPVGEDIKNSSMQLVEETELVK